MDNQDKQSAILNYKLDNNQNKNRIYALNFISCFILANDIKQLFAVRRSALPACA